MTYYERITTNKTWTCPKTGRYKIICVGGGASGGGKPRGSSTNSKQNTGGTTSFGSYVSAAGGSTTAMVAASAVGGIGGYTGVAYGGSGGCVYGSQSAVASTVNGGCPGTSGLGYGAGGGATSSSGTGPYLAPGDCGDLKAIELDIAVNQSVACTIGAGGAAVSAVEDTYTVTGTAGTAGCIDIRFIQ